VNRCSRIKDAWYQLLGQPIGGGEVTNANSYHSCLDRNSNWPWRGLGASWAKPRFSLALIWLVTTRFFWLIHEAINWNASNDALLGEPELEVTPIVSTLPFPQTPLRYPDVYDFTEGVNMNLAGSWITLPHVKVR